MNKQSIAWWTAIAVAAIFLLALSSLSNYSYFAAGDVVSLLFSISVLSVAIIAAMVAIYWVRRIR